MIKCQTRLQVSNQGVKQIVDRYILNLLHLNQKIQMKNNLQNRKLKIYLLKIRIQINNLHKFQKKNQFSPKNLKIAKDPNQDQLKKTVHFQLSQNPLKKIIVGAPVIAKAKEANRLKTKKFLYLMN